MIHLTKFMYSKLKLVEL